MKQKQIHPKLSLKERQKRRLKAITLFKQGYTGTEVARKLNVHSTSGIEWYHIFHDRGARALELHERRFSSQLTEEKSKRFKKIILSSPRAYGYDAERWTVNLLTQVLRKTLGVKFGHTWTHKMVKRMGFKFKKNRRSYKIVTK